MSTDANKIGQLILDLFDAFPSKKLSEAAMNGYIKRGQEYRFRTVQSVFDQLTRPGTLQRQYPNSLPSLFELTELLEKQKGFEDSAARHRERKHHHDPNAPDTKPSTPMGEYGRLGFENDGSSPFYRHLQSLSTERHEEIRKAIKAHKKVLGIGENSQPEQLQEAARALTAGMGG